MKFRSAYRTIFFLPMVAAPAAVAMVWKWLYNQQFGLLNQVLNTDFAWISNPSTAWISIGVIGVWSIIGYNMVLFLGGLQEILHDTVDRAARHAGSRRNRPDGRFVGFHLSIPCLSWSVDDRFQAVPNVSSIAQTRFWHKARKTFHPLGRSLVAFDKRKGAHRASFTNLQRAVDNPVLVR